VNGCYQLVTHKLNWTSAGQECRSLHKDAHLLVINDEQEQWSFAGMMESMRRKCLFHIFMAALADADSIFCPVVSFFFFLLLSSSFFFFVLA